MFPILAVNASASPIAYTLANAKLTATLGATATNFGQLTALTRVGSESVIASTSSFHASQVWDAGFVGWGSGKQSINSLSKCASTAVSSSTKTSIAFTWKDCDVPVIAPPSPGPPSPTPPPTPTAWVEHNASNCAGECVPKDNPSGPKGGHCDRMAGCGHDAGLPYCDPVALKKRCSNVTGCTAFNTNGYLYIGGGATPFAEYPLQCFTMESVPPAKQPTVTVTLTVTLTAAGMLEYGIGFTGNGDLALWDYTINVGNIDAGYDSAVASVAAKGARQLKGIYDPAGKGDAVYWAAHDPRSIVKTGAYAAGRFFFTVDALNATMPLHTYSADFPIVISVLGAGSDWWDIANTYRTWVLPNAEWTRFGPLETRTDLPT